MYPGGENERYLEVWNLVFSEYNHNKDHTHHFQTKILIPAWD